MIKALENMLFRNADRFDAGRLWFRYVFALALIFVLVVATHLLAVAEIRETQRHSAHVSESANQKARVEEVLSFAEMTHSLRTAAASDRLLAAVAALERTHNAFVDAEGVDPALERVYFQGGRGPALDPIIRKFIADARIIASLEVDAETTAAALARMRAVAGGVLQRVLQEVNEIHQAAIAGYSNALGMLQTATFALALLVLLLEALFIFLPAHVAVRTAFERLSAQAADLKRSQSEVETRNRALEAMRAAAEREAVHDGLTGILNRRGFEREIRRLAAQAEAVNGAGQIAIAHIDLDRFKQINDTLGHATGDAVLTHVAQVLTQTAARDDVVARVGGDEFVLARRCDGDFRQLEALAGRLIDVLSEPTPVEAHHCEIGASIGVAVSGAPAETGPIDPARLMADADIALYRAKELGRGRFEFFSAALRRNIEKTKALSDEVTLGLRRDEFFPVYQLQVDAVTGAVCGLEALARWRHPARGEIAPAGFIPIAERLGVMAAIDQMILSRAVEDLAAWDAAGIMIPSLSVNLSSAQLRDGGFAAMLSRIHVPRGRLAFEVLETVFADRVDDRLRFSLDALTEAGARIEIDDFGTGHSSLVSMLSLSPSRLKVARELVAPLPDSATHTKIIQSICDIARSLGIGVTAEGVETEAQRAALVALGCDRLQGFLFSRPMPANAIAAAIANAEARGAGASARA